MNLAAREVSVLLQMEAFSMISRNSGVGKKGLSEAGQFEQVLYGVE